MVRVCSCVCVCVEHKEGREWNKHRINPESFLVTRKELADANKKSREGLKSQKPGDCKQH